MVFTQNCLIHKPSIMLDIFIERVNFMEEKILDMQAPIISSYTSYGVLFSIMPETTWPWIMNHFIQIRYECGWGIFAFDNHQMFLSYCPCLESYIVPRKILKSYYKKSFKEFIIEVINQDNYLFLYVDRYYLPVFSKFHNKHSIHELLIYGYNLEKNEVYIADNLPNGKFGKAVCSFEEIFKAYWGINDESPDFQTQFLVIKQNPKIKCELDMEQIRLSLKNMIESRPTIDLFNPQEHKFGFEALEYMKVYTEEFFKKNHQIDIRPFHFMYEHIILMKLRVEYLFKESKCIEIQEINKRLEELEDEYTHIRNKSIKDNITRRFENIDEISNKLEKIIRDEEKVNE